MVMQVLCILIHQTIYTQDSGDQAVAFPGEGAETNHSKQGRSENGHVVPHALSTYPGYLVAHKKPTRTSSLGCDVREDPWGTAIWAVGRTWDPAVAARRRGNASTSRQVPLAMWPPPNAPEDLPTNNIELKCTNPMGSPPPVPSFPRPLPHLAPILHSFFPFSSSFASML